VDARLHCVAAGEAEGVADVDDCAADFWGDESEFFGSWSRMLVCFYTNKLLM
jgi:hypothetical protein